ncbi:DUF1822 family protein [Scytonema sp. UIC 10036]|uniref:DUF1822 family protein n=1 Tax=Scytonema sp. UIC 10036 TaxID=2304196 RepID=UPI0012DA6392|nr:DUF1822 family protein [Scytonema sp. UIC 10036]MUG98119.1 DUF1822 family protein [Scytonema sp. UIC 10036]
MFSLDKLRILYPESIWCYISESDREKAWFSSENFSNKAARWNSYLNLLCLNKCIAWLEADGSSQVTVYPSVETLPSIWEVVNGFALQVERTRLILILSEAIETEEFSVPQEWVDISSWAGHYYLAVQVNLADEWLRIWGYTTHKQLKTQGIYDEFERTYSLDKEDLITDLNVLWISQELNPKQFEVAVAVIEKLPSLSSMQAEKLVEKLSQPSPYSPRLEISFKEWGALIADDNWREHLYANRKRQLTSHQNTPVNLSNWLRNVFDIGWQTVEEFFGKTETDLVFAFRNRRTVPDNLETIKTQIEYLKTHPNDDKCKQTAKRVTENLVSHLIIDKTNPQVTFLVSDAVSELAKLLRTISNEEIRWTVAECLWMLEPDNPLAGKKRIKDWGMQLAGYTVALMVAILEKPDRKVAVLLRVYPMGNKNYLPESLQMTVLDEDGNTFLEAQTRKADNFIQLKFSGSPGDRFSVTISLETAFVTEDFVI